MYRNKIIPHCWLTWQGNGTFMLEASWHDDFKREFDALFQDDTQRAWNAPLKCWVVDAQHFDVVKKMLHGLFRDVTVAGKQTQLTGGLPTTQVRIMAEYITRTNPTTHKANVQVNGYFTHWVHEDVLRLYFKHLPRTATEKPAPRDSHYTVLGIASDADEGVVKKAYRRGAFTYHPDRNSESDARAMFLKIQRAYDVLRDASLRARYDVGLQEFGDELVAIPTGRLNPRMFRNAPVDQTWGYAAPVRCGWLTCEIRHQAKAEIAQIVDWQDDVRSDGKIRIASWDNYLRRVISTWEDL